VKSVQDGTRDAVTQVGSQVRAWVVT